MVLFLSFSQKNSLCEFFCEKDRESSALPEPALSVVEWGAIPRQTRDRLIQVSSGRFAGFAYFAVGVQTGRFTRWKPDSPAAAWYLIFLFHEMLARRANIS
jgi:hypothetical protein